MRRKVKSEFSNLFMRRIAIIFFELGLAKGSLKKFMIIYLLKNCALLQQIHISKEK